ncbi:MAG: hypothetical protein RL417_2201 [Pseudomonadota bacterium]|jgi:hypothetical protein
MSSSREEKLPPLEDGLLRAMQALDRQVAREMQRTPAEREEKGVRKWEPYEKRVENVTSFVLNAIGDDAATLDAVLILSQSFVKSLYLLAEELGVEGLGDIRSQYCRGALEAIGQDIARAGTALKGGPDIN